MSNTAEKRSGRRPPTKQVHQPNSQESTATESTIDKNTRAKDLESALEQLQQDLKSKGASHADSERKSSQIRLELCSLFSHVIIEDPQFSTSHNVVERIWKYCFYGRINELRSRLLKDKSRAKKRTVTGGGVRGGSVASNASSDNFADGLEKQLNQFLKEAEELYRYLIKKYGDTLSGESQASSTQSQYSQNDYHEAIISSLYRMHIHLGDLYRYSSAYKQAEESYLISVKLAPGTGNPHNQLAVVAQSQEFTTVALYYYARSLMPTFQPFETSRSNLVRLFETNHKWLSEHGRKESHSRGLLSEDGGKKARKEWLQKEKAALTRTTLCKLVDLQWAFYRGISADKQDGKVDFKELTDVMSSVLSDFNGLLSNSSCSEPLLCKIIAILAFSVLGASNEGKLADVTQTQPPGMGGRDTSSNIGIIMNNQAIAFSFLLRFCATLANKVVVALEGKGASGTGGEFVGPVRSLSPLLLGVNFAVSLYNGSKWFRGLPFYPQPASSKDVISEKCPVQDLCWKAHDEFLSSIATITNHLNALQLSLSNDAMYRHVHDFSEFYYYVPFASFLNDIDRPEISQAQSKYASLGEAVSALSSKKEFRSLKAGDEDINTKIRLFLSLVCQITRPKSASNSVTGPFFFEEDPLTNALTVLHEKRPPEVEVHDEQVNLTNNLDIIVANYEIDDAITTSKSQYSDLGVTLLTPAAILSNAAPPPPLPFELNALPKLDDIVPELTITQNRQTLQKTLPPPPGFEAPLAGDLTSLPSYLPDPLQVPKFNLLVDTAGETTSSYLGFHYSSNNAVMPQAGPSSFSTLNPFTSTLTNSHSSPNFNLSEGLDLNSILNNPRPPGVDSSNLLLGQPVQSIDQYQYNHNDSLLNFLFGTNDSDDQEEISQHNSSRFYGLPHTNNPFAG